MRLEDLPAKERRQVRRAIAAGTVRAAVDVRPDTRGRTRPPAVVSPVRPDTHTCHQCGRTFGSYPPAERHVDREHGHGRIACVL